MEKQQRVSKYNRPLSEYFIDVMREKRAKEVRESTLLRYQTVWDNQVDFFWGRKTPNTINRETYTNYVLAHKKKHPGKQLINANKIIRDILKYLDERQLIDRKNLPKVYLPKSEQEHHKEQKGQLITEQKFSLILDNTKTDRDRLIFTLAFSTGMRIGEICKLEKRNIVSGPECVSIYLASGDTKTGKARVIPLTDALGVALLNQFSDKSKFLFPARGGWSKPVTTKAVAESFRKACLNARIWPIPNFHSIRHTVATNFAKSNISPIIACQILGMSLSIYQNRYLKLKAEDLLGAINAIAYRG